jgi:hypothetical protein
MLREIVGTEDHDRQKAYLVRVYKWFFSKMNSIGAISHIQKQNEDEFMNPHKYEKIEQDRQNELHRKKARLQDNAYNNQIQKGWFDAGERTTHKDIIPAKDRITFYKRKLPKDPNSSVGESTSTRPGTKSSTTRPMTINSAKTRAMTAKTRTDSVYGQSMRPSYGTFFTSGEEVKYSNVMRVDSKSNYGNYIPTDDAIEQRLEKMWRQSKNREIAEKRCNDELKQNMKEWGDAKARYEEDLQRKNENMWFGSNFVARAFTRKTKTKNIDLARNHLNDSDGDSLMSDSEIEEEIRKEKALLEGEGEGNNVEGESPEGNNIMISKPLKQKHPDVIKKKRTNRNRVQTAGRNRRQPYMPKIFNASRDIGDKL